MQDLTATSAADRFRSAPDDFIEVGNGAAAYRKVGSGPDVLFSHGWPVTSATYRCLLPILAEHVTCHLIDFPGAGDSRFDRTADISMAAHAEALRRTADELGLTHFGVVGQDSGGLIARLAFAGDERVHGWGLIDTEQPPKPSWRFRSFVHLRSVPGFEKILRLVVTQRQIRRNPFVLGDVFQDKNRLDGEFDEFFLRPLRDDPERLWAAGQLLRRFDLGLFPRLTALHRQIESPVQLVWGGRDPFFPVDRARAMMAEFGGPVALEVIEQGKLFVHEEYPEQAAKALLKTIRG